MSLFLDVYPGDEFALFCANVFVQGTVIMLLALLVSLALKRASAAARYGVWLVAMCVMFLSPVTSWAADRAGVSVARIPLSSAVASETPETAKGVAVVEPAGAPGPDLSLVGATPASIDDPAPMVEPAVAAPIPDAPNRNSKPETRNTPLTAADILRAVFTAAFFVWCAGALVMFARLIYGWGVAAALRRSVRPVNDPGLAEVLNEVRDALGVKVLPRAVTSELIGSPISVGILNPQVILPKNLAFMIGREELRDVLVHECAHVLQRDHLVGLLQRLLECAMWPHPLVYKMHRELAKAREEVCDNFVLRGTDASRYARSLLDLAEKTTIFHRMPATVGLVHPRWKLEDRVKGLLDGKRRLVTRMNAWALSAVALAFLATGVIVAGCKVDSGSKKDAGNKTPRLIRVSYYAGRGADYRITKAKDIKAVLAWLETAGKGPVSEHAKNGLCDRDAKIELFAKKTDKQPYRTVRLFTACGHAEKREVTAAQFAKLKKIAEGAKPAEASALPTPIAIPAKSIRAKSIRFHLVPPGKEKRSGLYAMPGLAQWRDFPAPEGLFAKAASGRLGGLQTGFPGVWLIGKLPWRVNSSNFFVAGEGKIVGAVPDKYRKTVVGGLGAGGVELKEAVGKGGAGRIEIPVKFAHYRGSLGGKAGTLCHAYVTARLPALPAGKYKATMVFSDHAYKDLRLKEKEKLVPEAGRPARTLSCEFEVRAAKAGQSAFKPGEKVVARGVFRSLKGWQLELERKRWVLLDMDFEGPLGKVSREMRGKVLEITGSWIPARASDPEELKKMRDEEARTGSQGVGSWHASSPHVRVESFKVMAKKPPAGFKGFIRPAPKISWGKAVGGVRAGISPTRIVLGRDDSDIRFRLWYENTGSKPASVWLWEETAGEVFDVAHGMELKVRLDGRSDTWHAMASCPEDMGRRPKALKPGERVSQMIVLPVRVTQGLPMPRIGGKPAVVSAIAWPPREVRTKVRSSPRATGAVEVVRVASVPGTAWGFRGSKLPYVGLSAGSATLSANRPVDFTVHVRNSGSERARKVAGGLRSRLDWGLVFVPLKGGQAYVARNTVVDKMSRKLPAPFELRPGQSVTVDLDGGGWRFYPSMREQFTPLPYKFEPSKGKPNLPPGKYAVSACFPPPSGRGRNWRPQAVTGRVVIEVVTAKGSARKAMDSPVEPTSGDTGEDAAGSPKAEPKKTPVRQLGLKYVQTAVSKKDARAAVAAGSPYLVGYMGAGLVIPGLPAGSRRTFDSARKVREVTLGDSSRKYRVVVIEGVSDVIPDDAAFRQFKKAWAYAKRFNQEMVKGLKAARESP